MRAVYADMPILIGSLAELEGRHATDDELRLVHEAGYLDEVRAWSMEAGREGRPQEVRPGLVASAASWDASVAAVGSALTAIDAVLEGVARNAFCAIRPPGRDSLAREPGRFGFLNAPAIAVRFAQRHGLDRLLLVEWGAFITGSAATLLAHDEGLAVGRVGGGEAGPSASTRALDRILDRAADGPAFEAAVRSLLEEAGGMPGPDMILLSAGFDCLADDPLGELNLTGRDIYNCTRLMVEFAEAASGGRLVSMLEGGYGPGLGSAVTQHLRALAGLAPAE
jgi:acetoin utilization deacetylase AcuC-like enzyme